MSHIHTHGATRVIRFENLDVEALPLRPPAHRAPRLLTQLLDAHSGAERLAVLADGVEAAGFDELTYARIDMVRGEPVPSAFCISKGDGAWISRYLARRDFAVDPRLNSALRSRLPIRWSLQGLSRSAGGGRGTAAQAEFLASLAGSEAERGIMFAMIGPKKDERSVVSVLSTRSAAAAESAQETMRVVMLALCIHEFHLYFANWSHPRAQAPSPPLGDRQVQILQALAEGMTDRQIAVSLQLTMHGVDYHLRRLRERFGARNRVELVQAALRKNQAD